MSEEISLRPIVDLPIVLALEGCVTAGGGSPGAGVYTYEDFLRPHGRERGDAAEQAATRACDRGDSQRIGTPKFDACMRARGWRLANFAASSSNASPSPSYDSGAPAGPDPSLQISQDLAASQAANDAAQQANNAAAAAATQTEVQFNTIYNNPN
jgi:hypothetical protein